MAKLSEKPDITVCEWTASLYEEKKRKWLYGTLSLKATEVTFTTTPTTDSDVSRSRSIPYEDIIEVRKSTTGLVFGAVYLVKKNNEKVWLSSLPDREGVYGALRHFTRQKLLKGDDVKRSVGSKGKTEMGQKLLGIVDDSERTLNKAAVQLVEQGHQIDQAISTMADLHSDLDIVENLVGDLQSWVGRWRMPDDYQAIDPVFVNKSEIPEVFEYEILYTKLQTGVANTKNLGDMRILKGGITILTAKKKTEHHFKWGDVSQLRVMTPWEMIVIQNKIGEPDLKYSIISANMVAILKLLDKCCRYKLKYDTPPDRVVCIKGSQIDGRPQWNQNQGSYGGGSNRASYFHLTELDTDQEKDVLLLNNCFDDIENFVSRLQEAEKSYKDLESRRMGSTWNKHKNWAADDGMLIMRSPPAEDFIDIFQKFKFAFNLLAKLKGHLKGHDPNASEMVHFLFTPLSLIFEASRDPIHNNRDLSGEAVTPLLLDETKQFLLHCLTSEELKLLQSLGKPWTLTESPTVCWNYKSSHLQKTPNQSLPLDLGIEVQVNQSKQVVSESEADEISRALIGLKSLAVSVQKEELRQNERIDSLTQSVDRANQRLVVNEKKVKKMI